MSATPPRLPAAVVSELLGTAMLVAAVVGSGIMAVQLSAGNDGLALLANSLATGAALVALIITCGPVSGAHFNPVVTLVSARAGDVPWRSVPPYVGAQLLGGALGTFLTHAMFERSAVAVSTRVRGSAGAFLSEVVATFGLVMVIRSCSRNRPSGAPFAVAAYIREQGTAGARADDAARSRRVRLLRPRGVRAAAPGDDGGTRGAGPEAAGRCHRTVAATRAGVRALMRWQKRRGLPAPRRRTCM